MPTCEICGSHEFRPGPKGRIARNGQPPRCVGCKSLERHRIARRILAALDRDDAFRGYRAMQFSVDPSVDRRWFASFERSRYDGPNSMDVQDIPRPDGAYDFVMCSHVIEHVPDHRRAISELVRILSPRGLMLLAYPTPISRADTEDWGYPDPAQHYHYRILGRDFEREYQTLVPDCWVWAVTGVDSVTTMELRLYLVTKSRAWMERIRDAGLDIESVSTPVGSSD